MFILFVDQLGMKARWNSGGRERAEKAFDEFARLMEDSIEICGSCAVYDGVIETDSAAIVFHDVCSAILCARSAYNQSFVRFNSEERVWLRGVIIPANKQTAQRSTSNLISDKYNIKHNKLDGKMLDAISVEKSGFKGMRLLIANHIVDSTVRSQFSMSIGKFFICPFRELENSDYPKSLEDNYLDFLWMATGDCGLWGMRKITMAKRLRLAGKDKEEVVHAAATQIIFHECAAILNSIRFKQNICC